MAKVDDLLVAGIVTELEGDATKVVFNVPLHIPKVVVNNNGFELFAKTYGWTETVKDENGEEINNPETVHAKGISVIRNFAWEVLTVAMKQAVEKAAGEAVLVQVAALRGK
jgi:hypothetical protein